MSERFYRIKFAGEERTTKILAVMHINLPVHYLQLTLAVYNGMYASSLKSDTLQFFKMFISV